MAEPLIQKLPPGSAGLDFGCGPGPALAHLLRDAGFAVDLYDPFYFPDQSVFQKNYDFITSTEVFEHLHSPAKTIPQILKLLHPGSWLGVMTKLSTGIRDFPQWHYKNDRTHVAFYSPETFRWMAQKWGLTCEILGKDVILLQKP